MGPKILDDSLSKTTGITLLKLLSLPYFLPAHGGKVFPVKTLSDTLLQIVTPGKSQVAFDYIFAGTFSFSRNNYALGSNNIMNNPPRPQQDYSQRDNNLPAWAAVL